MAIFNYAAREMTAKIVYYGPGLSGKTTSIQYIHSKISPKSKGKLVSLATETDRTLFFDFFPVEFGQIGGFKVKFNFYTVPGQVFYNTTRKLVLKGADGVVFVADSQPGMMEQNQESLENLRENLTLHGIDPENVPFVMQYNKRDMPGVQSVEEMRRLLNSRGIPDFETCAATGPGVMESMKAICKLVLEDIQKKQKGGVGKGAGEKVAATQAAMPRAEIATGEWPIHTPPVAERPGSPGRTPAVERSLTVPVRGPSSTTIVLSLPLDLQLEPGVEAVQISAELRVSYRGGSGQVLVRELTGGAKGPASGGSTGEMGNLAQEAPKKGFFARLFGR